MTDERSRSNRARVLRNSPRAKDREESERIFRQLRESANTGIARDALERSSHATYEKPARENAALAEMRTAWMGLRSPMSSQELDHRFERFFADVERSPDLLENLAPRMLASATDWLADYERVSNVAGTEGFDAWAELVRKFPRVAEALSDVINQWSTLKSKRRLDAAARDVEAAIESDKVNDAWNALNDIADLQDVYAAKFEELRDAIGDLEKRKAEIEAWQNELAGAPATWADVARLYELWAKGRRLVQARGTPRESANKIQPALDYLQAQARDFIAKRAEKWTSLDDVRSEITMLSETSRGRQSVIDETWLETLVGSMVRLVDRAIEGAQSNSALRRVSAGVAAIAAMLPAGGGRHVQDALRRITAIVKAWDALASEDSSPTIPDGVVPARFAEQSEKARLLLERVAVAENTLHRGETTAERAAACRDAIALLDEILTDAPQHPAARTLLDRANARLETIRLDECIERWDIAELRSALDANDAHAPVYASLVHALPVLDKLSALRRRKPAADLSEILAWWKSWRDLGTHLPASMPDALRGALEAVRRDLAAAARTAIADHLERVTTVEDDRAAEVAVESLVSELHLGDQLVALTQRRTIHAAVEAARKAGTSALAVLLRDSWGTIQRYLPGAASIVGEALERAWDEDDDEALDALRDVVLRDQNARADTERFRQWLEWLDIEKSLSASPTSDSLRRLQRFVQRDGSAPSVVRRLARLIDKWREQGDDAALVWASRAFAHVDPPLFPGVDPLTRLTRRSTTEIEAIFRVCREAATVDDAFLRQTGALLDRTEEAWRRVEQLLIEVPVPPSEESWPAPPPELRDAKALLAAFRSVLDAIARWKRSDLRSLGVEWDAVRGKLLRELSAYPAAEAFERVLRKVEPLTRLNALQEYFHAACGRCQSELPADRARLDAFADAARCLVAIIDTLQASKPEGEYTSRVVSEEYWRDTPQRVGDLLPPNPTGGLDALHDRLQELQDNDTLFADAIAILWREQPNIGAAGDFDADAHPEYIAYYPQEPPSSIRVRHRFDELAARTGQRIILRKSRALLPAWLQRFVDNVSRGVSPW